MTQQSLMDGTAKSGGSALQWLFLRSVFEAKQRNDTQLSVYDGARSALAVSIRMEFEKFGRRITRNTARIGLWYGLVDSYGKDDDTCTESDMAVLVN